VMQGGPTEVECYLRSAKPCVDRKKEKKTLLSSDDQLPTTPCKQQVQAVKYPRANRAKETSFIVVFVLNCACESAHSIMI